jgi:hypothetical protein
MPWLTWVTTPRVPAFAPAGPNDRLLLADAAWRDAAAGAGWPAERIDTAGWPTPPSHDAPAPSGLTLVADTAALDAPESLVEFSSHCLLWETVRQAVLRDPFALPADVAGWVRDLARAHGIANDTLDVAMFVGRLVIPAYQQALAEALLAAGAPLRLYGRGWGDLPRFTANAAGEVTSREHLTEIARDAAALVHAWPAAGAHAIDAFGRPVIRRTGRRRETFLRDASLALKGALGPRGSDTPLSAVLLARLLGVSSAQA